MPRNARNTMCPANNQVLYSSKDNEYLILKHFCFFLIAIFFIISLIRGISEHEKDNLEGSTKMQEDRTIREENFVAHNIETYEKLKETHSHLLAELHQKQEELVAKQEEVARFWNDVQRLISHQFSSSSTSQMSATTRMKEESEKQKILEAWRLASSSPSSDPSLESHQKILALLKEISLLNMQITDIKKEMQQIKQKIIPHNSAQERMSTEKKKREQTPKHEVFTKILLLLYL